MKKLSEMEITKKYEEIKKKYAPMGRGTWKNFGPSPICSGSVTSSGEWWGQDAGEGSRFPGLGGAQRKDMKHVNNNKEYEGDMKINDKFYLK